MTKTERDALVERMAAAIIAAGYNPATASDIARAALAVAEPVVRADEREACIAATRKALTAYGRWQAAITPDTLMAKIEPAIRASAVGVG